MLLLHYDLAFVEYGPVPPHERDWRHPSELAAAEQAEFRAEPVPPAVRWFAITTGSIGLVAIAVLVMTVSPSRSASPVAMSATTAPVSAASLDQLAPTIAAVRRPSVVATTAGIGVVTRALATPIDAGDYAVVSAAAVAGHDPSALSVVLPSGRLASAQLVDTGVGASSETLLIVLDRAEPGHHVSEHRPKDREVVTVMSNPPVTVAYADIASLAVAEGTAVIDESGGLVGICSGGDGGRGTKVLAIDARMGGSTPDPTDTDSAGTEDDRVDPPTDDGDGGPAEETADGATDDAIDGPNDEATDDRSPARVGDPIGPQPTTTATDD